MEITQDKAIAYLSPTYNITHKVCPFTSRNQLWVDGKVIWQTRNSPLRGPMYNRAEIYNLRQPALPNLKEPGEKISKTT